jgi:hypothetical protein
MTAKKTVMEEKNALTGALPGHSSRSISKMLGILLQQLVTDCGTKIDETLDEKRCQPMRLTWQSRLRGKLFH